LRFGEVKTLGDVGSVGDAEIFLTAELPFEVLQLGVSERGTSTSKFLRRQLAAAAAPFVGLL